MENGALLSLNCGVLRWKDECRDSYLLLTQMEVVSKVVFNNVALLDLLPLVNSTRNLHLGIYSQGLCQA